MCADRRFDLSEQRLALLERMLREQGVERTPIQTVPRRRDRAAPVPLSFSQQQLWFLEQLAPGNPAYVIPIALRVHGELVVPAFTRACDQVVRRHESLRTVFATVDGQPRQRVLSQLPPAVTVVDCWGESITDAEVCRRADAMFRTPFDLTTGPLLRVELLRVATDESVLLLAMHHIVSDLWSLGVLLRELVACYRANVLTGATGLPELPVQYSDFALWQQRESTAETWRDDLDYWVGQLSGAPSELDLPTDQARPDQHSFQGRSEPVELPPALTAGVRTLARTQQTTGFTVLAAAYQALLFRLSGQPDILVGTPVANRSRPELEPLIGFLVNTVVLRSDLSGNPSFRTLVDRVGKICLAAFEHQHLPFERLVEQLQPARSLGRTPLFQVAFLYQNVPFPPWDGGPVRIEPIPVTTGSAKFDLELQLFEDGDEIRGRLEASSDLFDQGTVRRMATYFRRLVQGAVADPDQPLSALPMLDDYERSRMISNFNEPWAALEAELGELLPPAGRPTDTEARET